MKLYKEGLIIFLSVFQGFSCQGQMDSGISLNTSGKFQEEQVNLIADLAGSFPEQTQLSFAIVKDGTTNFYGVVNSGGTLVNIENHSAVFEIGSITKVLTCQILANLVVEGKVDLNSTIQNDLKIQMKEPEKEGEAVTYLTLANHTSGLPRMPLNLMSDVNKNPQNPYSEYTRDRLDFYLENQQMLVTTPGDKYAYSNLGMGLLGQLLEDITTKEYEELLRLYIFLPFEMTRSTSIRSKVQDDLVGGLNPKGELTSNWDLSSLEGAGAVLSSAEDMAKFAAASFEANAVNELQQKETKRVDKDLGLGLGWHFSYKERGKMTWHNGGTGGYRSMLVMDTDTRSAVIVLSNVSAFNQNQKNIDQLGFQLLESLD